jgi:hypothetical protein
MGVVIFNQANLLDLDPKQKILLNVIKGLGESLFA